MPDVITLIGYAARPLDEGDVAEFCLSLDTDVKKQNWLCPSEACDVFPDALSDETRAHVYAWAAEQKLDVIIQNADGRRKKALCADMESTIIHEEMLEELAAKVNLREKVEIITRRAMNGELDFKAALKERLALLAGLSESVITELLPRMTIMEGAFELIATMRGHGARCVLVSGGFKAFTGAVAKQLHFDEEHGNILDIKNGKLTGDMVEPVLDKTSKLAILKQTAASLGISTAAMCAVGDGANDLPMLLEAGLGIAYRAKPAVQAEARFNIRYASLRALLWAQGYRSHDLK